MPVIRTRYVVLLLLVILIGLAGMALHQLGYLAPAERFITQFLAPVQIGISRVGQGISNLRLGISDMRKLRAENEQLTAEVEQLRSLVIALKEAENENRILREQMGFTQANPTYDLVPAQIIGRDPDNFVQSLSIDRGTRDGVREGKIVVAAGQVRMPGAEGSPGDQIQVVQGLVGTVVHAGPNYAKILLISDLSSAVNVMLQGTRADGLVTGNGRNPLALKYVRQGEPLAPGAVLLTSGLGGAYPRGLVVGFVTSIQTSDQSTFQSGSVQPIVDLQRLEIVFVVRSFDPIKVGE